MKAEWFSHFYRIDLKETPERYYEESPLKVLPTSPWLLRREVEKFAHYFRREFHYDHVQFEASWSRPYTAYILPSEDGFLWAGACCFQSVCFGDVGIPAESLEWLWPFAVYESVSAKAQSGFGVVPAVGGSGLRFGGRQVTVARTTSQFGRGRVTQNEGAYLNLAASFPCAHVDSFIYTSLNTIRIWTRKSPKWDLFSCVYANVLRRSTEGWVSRF